jgi:hypothetical protein
MSDSVPSSRFYGDDTTPSSCFYAPESDEEDSPGLLTRTASGPCLSPELGVAAAVITGVVKQATEGLKSDNPIQELLTDVPVSQEHELLISRVRCLETLCARHFLNEEERKAAIMPDLMAIRDAIETLQEDHFKFKLKSLVSRINDFAQ